jgi:hypothetical protein
MPTPAAATMQPFVGKNIKDICANEYINDAHNHCAHFVAHAGGYSYGYTCRQQTGKGVGSGATIRVNDLFAKCPEVGRWADKLPTLDSCLVFVTDAAHVNLALKNMTDHPQKHIGIFTGGVIYHYSNGGDRVVTDLPEAFEKKFKSKYSGKNVTMFFGKFPA